MTRTALLASTAVALCMCAAAATAQAQGKEPDRQGPAAGESRAQENSPAPIEKGQRGDAKGKGSAQSEPRDRPTKGTAQTDTKDRPVKGAEQTPDKPATKGAQKAEPKDKGRAQVAPKDAPSKDRAQSSTPGDQRTKGAAGDQKGDAPKSAQAPASKPRVQLSEQQRNGFRDNLFKDRGLNRAQNVKITVTVGTRVPRTLRLAVLPVTVISLVPQYRSYRYVVIDDRICIVDPDSYEIVEVIDGPTHTAHGGATLVLSEDERAIILGEVDLSAGSTLALGGLAEGSDVPSGVQLRVFPERVVERVPRLSGYRFFTAENRIAIIDPAGSKVRLVIDGRRR